jgi:hypothetical protein
MTYSSSSKSTTTTTRKLRPSVTITKLREIQRQQKSSINEQWSKIFSQRTTTQNDQESKSHRRQLIQTTLLENNTTNEPAGDNILNDSDDDTIIFHNINGIKDEANWHQILNTMQEFKVQIMGFVEINKSLNNQLRHQWKDVAKKFFKHNKITHSESKVNLGSEYKPGGTLSMTCEKWHARVTEQGQDSRGLGRWSYQKISSTKSTMYVVTAYRPCATHGPTTAWIQQWLLLKEEGRANPDPVKEFYKDITEQIKKWKGSNAEILLLMDANETIGDKPGGPNCCKKWNYQT